MLHSDQRHVFPSPDSNTKQKFFFKKNFAPLIERNPPHFHLLPSGSVSLGAAAAHTQPGGVTSSQSAAAAAATPMTPALTPMTPGRVGGVGGVGVGVGVVDFDAMSVDDLGGSSAHSTSSNYGDEEEVS